MSIEVMPTKEEAGDSFLCLFDQWILNKGYLLTEKEYKSQSFEDYMVGYHLLSSGYFFLPDGKKVVVEKWGSESVDDERVIIVEGD